MLFELSPCGAAYQWYVRPEHTPWSKIGDGPEGPEVKTMADDLAFLCDSHLLAIDIPVGSAKLRVDGTVYGRTPFLVVRVWASGKKVLIEADDGRLVVFSLGMTGRLLTTELNHTRATLEFGTNYGSFVVLDQRVYFDDSRKFGSMVQFNDLSEFHREYKLGPDVLEAAILGQVLAPSCFRQEKRAICKVLLAQEVVAGIGNYLKSDILYASGVHPEERVSSLSEATKALILKNAAAIILDSYRKGGYTMSDYLRPSGAVGTYMPICYGQASMTKLKTSDGRVSYIDESRQVLSG